MGRALPIGRGREFESHYTFSYIFRKDLKTMKARKSRKPLFKIGEVVATKRVNERMEKSQAFDLFCRRSLVRHIHGDWGSVSKLDKRSNDEAVYYGDRILSVYPFGAEDKIWIITEADRSHTTILFPDEY